MKKRIAKTQTTLFAVLFAISLIFTSQTSAHATLEEAIADFQQKLPNIFHELSSEDIGQKPRLKPHLSISNGFTSDADLGASQSDPAYLGKIVAGANLELPLGERLYSELGYTYTFRTIQGRDTNTSTNGHSLNALAAYDLTDDTSVGVRNRYTLTQLPGTPGDNFEFNNLMVDLSHQFSPRLRVTVYDELDWFNDRSEEQPPHNDNQTYLDNGVGIKAEYKYSDGLVIKPSFVWNVREFDQIEGKDYYSLTYNLAASYMISPLTRAEAHVGWVRTEFDEGSDTTSNDLTWGASVSHTVHRKLTLLVGYEHKILDTFDTSFVNRVDSEVNQLDNIDRNFRLLRVDRIGTSLKYHIAEKHSAQLFGDFQWVDGDAEDNVLRTAENDEKSMEIGAAYLYRINRYLNLNLTYTFGRRFSSEDNDAIRDPYTVHRVNSGLSVKF